MEDFEIDLTAAQLFARCEVCGWRTTAKPAARDTFLHSLTVHRWHFCVPGKFFHLDDSALRTPPR